MPRMMFHASTCNINAAYRRQHSDDDVACINSDRICILDDDTTTDITRRRQVFIHRLLAGSCNYELIIINTAYSFRCIIYAIPSATIQTTFIPVCSAETCSARKTASIKNKIMNKYQYKSTNYVINNTFRKIFNTRSRETVGVCLEMFGCLQAERAIAIRKRKFLNEFSITTHCAGYSLPLLRQNLNHVAWTFS